MPITFTIDDSKLDLDGLVPKRSFRSILRKAGTSTATRLRQRLGRRTDLKKSRQLMRSLKSRLRSNEDTVVIAFAGTRTDADTHRHRPPVSNFSVAAFLAARGFDPLGMNASDENFFMAEIERMIFEAIEKRGG